MTEEQRRAMDEMARRMGHRRQEPGPASAAPGDGEKNKHPRGGQEGGDADGGDPQENGGPTWAPKGTTGKRAGKSLLHAVPERWKTNPNKAENQFLMDLMILKNSVATKRDRVAGRLGMVNPYARRDLALLDSLVDRIQTQMMETMPLSRWEYYDTLARYGRYRLDIEGPIRQGRKVLITDIKLARLCEAVMESECLMCLRDGKQIEKCPIRDALLEVAPPTETQEDGATYRCEYAGAAGQLVEGKDVTI